MTKNEMFDKLTKDLMKKIRRAGLPVRLTARDITKLFGMNAILFHENFLHIDIKLWDEYAIHSEVFLIPPTNTSEAMGHYLFEQAGSQRRQS